MNDIDDERETAALLGQLKAQPSADARERAFAKLSAEFHAARPAELATRKSPRRWAVAAALVVLVAGGVAWQAMQPAVTVARLESLDGSLVAHGTRWFSGDAQVRTGAALAAGDLLTVSNNGGALLRLSPDLTVRLAANTRARLGRADEIELIVGEAFVDATPGTHGALRIVTPHGVVTHLGTQYLVRSDREEIEVSVREGRAQLQTGQSTSVAAAGEWILHRGRDGGMRTGTLPVDDSRYDWIAALPSGFTLDGATLDQFLTWFHRETGLAPVYVEGLDSGHLGEVQLKGSIDNLEPLEALSLVLATADLAWHRDGAKVIIEKRPGTAG
jgi:ferric-dicitrate binding protein FerR (iron transport regulator)